MKKIIASALVYASMLNAGSSDTQTIDLVVPVINEIAISGTETITVASGGAGKTPVATPSTTTYAITTNETIKGGKKISCQLDSAWTVDGGSADILTLAMGAPSSGTAASATAIPASPTAAFDYITGIVEPVVNSGLSLTFVLDTTNLPSGNQSRTATYTLTDS